MGGPQETYRVLLSQFLQGHLPEERFECVYLDRLAKEALWRDDETFSVLNSLFENELGARREGRAARRGRVSGAARRPARVAEGARRADARAAVGSLKTRMGW
jgi:hypothetical protein